MSRSGELPSYAFRDVGAVVSEVLTSRVLHPGDALLVLVRAPSTQAVVEHVSRIRRGRWRALDQMGRSDLLGRVVDAMPVPKRVPGVGPSHSVLTLIGRQGFVVFGRDEAEWFTAWHYSPCLAQVFKGDLVLVTEHGWCDLLGDTGDVTPRIAA